MARYEHLPIYKKSFELAVYLEQVVAGFARRHKYGLGARLQAGARDVVRRVIRAQNAAGASRAEELYDRKWRRLMKKMKKSPLILLVLSISVLLPARGDTGWKRFGRTEPAPDQPVVADAVTGLVWQGCASGQSGPDCSTGGATTHVWNAAVSYCDALDWGGYIDWRLPDIRELYGIADSRRTSPSIDPAAFPATPSSYFWSSSSYAADSSLAWFVPFDNGRVYFLGKDFARYVRCVRGGP
ncbi:MAG: DUF1566 domain-containing protein [Planctomycetota bacterium]